MFFDKVCNAYHNNKGDKVHTMNSDWSLTESLDLRDVGVNEPISMRARVGRNLTNFPLPGVCIHTISHIQLYVQLYVYIHTYSYIYTC